MIGESDDAFVPDTQSFAIFFLLKCGDPDQWLRWWSGVGDYPVPADAYDTTGGTYTHLPFPQSLPDLGLAINGAFRGLDFSLSGVNDEILRAAGMDRDLVNASKIHIGLVDLDERQAPVNDLDWLFQCVAGKPSIKRAGQPGQAVRSVSLPSTTAFQDRHLAQVAYLTPAGQHARSPDDSFCDRTPGYSANSTVQWPG